MIDPAIIQPVATIVVALITAVASIIVAYIQASKKPPVPDKTVALPEGVTIVRRPTHRTGWIIVLTVLGGVFGYVLGGAFKTTSSTPTPTAPSTIFAVATPIVPGAPTLSPQPTSSTTVPAGPAEPVTNSPSPAPTASASPGGASAAPATSTTANVSTFRVITVRGEEISLTSLSMGIRAYQEMVGAAGRGTKIWTSQLYDTGIPMKNGEEVLIDYVSRVEFDHAESSVTITLTDGTVKSGPLASDRYPSLSVYGETPVASLERAVQDIKTILVERQGPAIMPPQALPSGLRATVVYTSGETIEVSRPGLEYFSGGYALRAFGQCEVVAFNDIPTVEGLRVQFVRIKDIELMHQEAQLSPLSARVTALDGQQQIYQIAPTYPPGESGVAGDPCWGGWRVTGELPLGRFSVLATAVTRLIIDH